MNPKFAVLIKGDWGCGKTHLVKKILEDSFGEDLEKKVIWLSVYGLSTIHQVKQKLYEKNHPILTSKAAKIVLGLAKTALKTNIPVDVNDDDKTDFTLMLSGLDLEQEQDNAKKKKLLVIDDIERCSIPPCELLGFFADSILDKDMKAIFIGNIEKMPSDSEASTGANKQEFNKIK